MSDLQKRDNMKEEVDFAAGLDLHCRRPEQGNPTRNTKMPEKVEPKTRYVDDLDVDVLEKIRNTKTEEEDDLLTGDLVTGLAGRIFRCIFDKEEAKSIQQYEAIKRAIRNMDIGVNILGDGLRDTIPARSLVDVLRATRFALAIAHDALQCLTSVPDTPAFNMKMMSIQTETWLKTLEAYSMDTCDAKLREREVNLNAVGQICFPLAMYSVVRTQEVSKSLAYLLDGNLLKIGYHLEAEQDFKEKIDKVEKPDRGVTWSPLEDIARKALRNRFMLPSTKEDLWEFYLEHDIFDKHVRKREDYLIEERFRVNGMKQREAEIPDYWELALLRKVTEFCLNILETQKADVFTLGFESYDEILQPYPEYEKVNALIEEWIRESFDEPTQEYFLKDQVVYACVSHIYSWVPNTEVLAGLGKKIVLALYVDAIAEAETTFVFTLRKAFQYAQKPESEFPVDEFTAEGWPEAYTKACKVFIALTRELSALVNVNVGGYWERWSLTVMAARNRKYETIEEYWDARNSDIGMDCYSAVVAGYFGIPLEKVPERVRRVILTFYSVENDLFSYGKEVVEAGSDRSRMCNSIEVYKTLNPHLTYQQVVNYLESFRDDLYRETKTWRGTENEGWHLSCSGVRYVTINAKRYSTHTITSRRSMLVRITKGQLRRDHCIVHLMDVKSGEREEGLKEGEDENFNVVINKPNKIGLVYLNEENPVV